MSGLELEGLTRTFGARTAIRELTFSVARGEVFGLLGPNGAGKTTTVRILSGLLAPSGGRARVAGMDVVKDAQALRARVGLLTEQPGLYERLAAADNLRFFMKLHGLDEADAWRRAAGWLERLGLADRLADPCGSFSKGMRQKLALVRTLLHAPEVLFLDEPTSGLDPASARSVRDLIAELAAEGRTIVLCTHNLAEVERLCTRVAVVKTTLRALAPVAALRGGEAPLELRLEQPAAGFVARVQHLDGVQAVRAEGVTLTVHLAREAVTPDVVASLVAAGARICAVQRASRPLEDAYLELVREAA